MKVSGLTLRTKLGFGIGDLGGNLFFTIAGFYLLVFLTDTVRLEAGLAGVALMIGKAWDAVTDPAVGYLSDITRTRWGRRRPYMAAGGVAVFLSMLVMFTVPGMSGQAELFVWASLAYCLLNTAYTLVNIPYGALTPELTTDYHERTVLSGYRMSFAVIGTFLGAGLVMPIVDAFPDRDRGWLVMGAAMGGIMLVSTLVTVAAVKEPPFKDAAGPVVPVLKSNLEVLRQRPFLFALIPWALHISGITVVQSALVYYFRYILGQPSAFQAALMILLTCAVLFIPFWVFISRHIGKKLAYNIGMSVFALTIVVLFLAGENGGLSTIYVIMGFGGVGFAAQYAMPYAIVPDVIDYDFAENGTRREGVYYGMWTFVSKVGQSVAILVAGLVLSISGYIPDAAQGEQAKLGIRLLVGLVPAAFFIAGVVVHSFYPITRERYEQIRAKAEARGSSSDS